jgi:hypothetical protein
VARQGAGGQDADHDGDGSRGQRDDQA